jgi:hypothetical protein
MAKLKPHVVEDVQPPDPDPIKTTATPAADDPIETAATPAANDPIETVAAPAANDPFDLSKLRLSQDFVETAGVKKLLTTVPVRKPHSQEFIRVHSSPEYRAALAAIELKNDREWYLLTPDIARELPGEFVSVMLFTTINRQGVIFLTHLLQSVRPRTRRPRLSAGSTMRSTQASPIPRSRRGSPSSAARRSLARPSISAS